MNVLGLIPARGGSRRIPRKNIRLLGGKPLVAWTIEAARSATLIDRVVVSTEDEEIADIARAWGADVPFLRLPELAGDESSGVAPVLHAIDQLPDFDWVLLLQPTSPLRNAEDIDGVVRFCQERKACSVVSLCSVAEHPSWMFSLDRGSRMRSLTGSRFEGRRSQELEPVYRLNGSLYLANCDWLRRHGSFVGSETLGYITPVERSVDIDTLLDWRWAEFLLESGDA